MTNLTVVLPVRNGANYIREAIDSVLSQDFRDFELHIHDDASTDSTLEIASAVRDPRVRIFSRTEPKGLFGTLNEAFEKVSTELVRIWAHDDIMVPGSLRKFVDFANAHPSVGVVYCDFVQIDEAGKRIPPYVDFRGQRRQTPEIAGPTVSALLFLYYGCLPGNISTVMMRRSIWERIGRFTPRIQQAPDYDMWVRASELTDVGFISEPLVLLREHELQLSSVGRKQMTTIQEEWPVIVSLRSRLGDLVSESEFDRLWADHRGRQHIHWVFRALMRGDFAGARAGWNAVKLYGRRSLQLLRWLMTANGRWGTLAVVDVVDRKLPLCRALDDASRFAQNHVPQDPLSRVNELR